MSLSSTLEDRFAYLEGLEQGWYGGQGEKISAESMTSARLFLETTQLEWKVEPLVSGGVSLSNDPDTDSSIPIVIIDFPGRNGNEGAVLIIE